MNAKQRRIAKRRDERRFGLTDQQFKSYRSLTTVHGYDHDYALAKAKAPKDQA